MTGPRIDFSALDDWSYGDRASRDNQYWLKVQSDVLRQMRDDLGLLRDANFADVQAGTSTQTPYVMPTPKTIGEQMRNFFKFQVNRPEKDSQLGRNLIMGIHQLEDMPLSELFGRAKALGIDNPEQVPVELLKQHIAERRLDVAPENFSAMRNVASQIANFGIGAAEGVVNQFTQWGKLIPDKGVERGIFNTAPLGLGSGLSWLKDVVKGHRSIDQNTEMFARLEEGVRANQDASQLGKYQSAAAGIAGQLAGGLVIGVPLFRAFSAVADIPMFASITGKYVGPLMRGAIAGGATSLAFDAGSEKPWLPSEADFSRVFNGDLTAEERTLAGVNGLFGSRVMSAVTGTALAALFDRVNRDFPHAAQQDRPSGFAERTNETVDADWWWGDNLEGPGLGGGAPTQPTLPGGPAGLLGAGEPNVAAMERQYLRALPGESETPVSLGNLPESPLNAPQRPLAALQGPHSPELASEIERVRGHVQTGELNLRLALESGDQTRIESATALLEDWQQRLAHYEEAPRMTRTPEDITPELVELRDKQVAIERAIESFDEPTTGNQAPRTLYDALELVKNQVDTLKRQAGLPKRSADPQHWEWFKQNAPRPATASQALVDQYGTVIRHEDGTPQQLYHGTGRAYIEIDPSTLTGQGNLAGPGFYLTDNPSIAGGDLLEPWEEAGYANVRSAQITDERARAEAEVTGIRAQMAHIENGDPGYPDTAYAELAARLPGAEARLEQASVAAPNVRLAYAAAKKLFDFDSPVDREDAFAIMRAVHEQTGSDLRNTTELMEQTTRAGQSELPGKVFYDSLRYDEVLSTHANGWPSGLGVVGDAAVNEALQLAGYDGIHYIANQRIGGNRYKDSHAYNIFDPRHVIPTYLSEPAVSEAAAAIGVQMSKQADIMQSPALEDLASVSKFTDSDVVKAQIASNPGGITVLRGITDPAVLVRQLAEETMGGSLMGVLKSYRVVPREGRNDLLVSTLESLDDSQVFDYQQYGVFKGMDVVKPNGMEAKVIEVFFGGDVKVQTAAQAKRGLKYGNSFNAGQVAPSKTGVGHISAPDLYEDFRRYATYETTERVVSSGQLVNPDWFDHSVFVRMPELLGDYLDGKGLIDMGVRAAIVRDFNLRRIEDAKMFAPEYFDALDTVRAEADATHEMALSREETPNARTYAALRGFNLVPNEGQPGFVLEDQFSEVKLPMADEGAVVSFLNTYQRDLPDQTPSSVFPMELAEIGNDSGLMNTPDGDDHVGHIINELSYLESDEVFDSMFQDIARSGTSDEFGLNPRLGDQYSGRFFSGGGGSPPLPPSSGGVAASGSSPQLPSGRTRDMVRRELAGLEGRMGDLMARYDGMMTRVFTPMRTIFSRLEDDLAGMGVKNLRPWQDFDNIVTGMTMAHNEANPILNQIGHELRFVKKQKLRNGFWWQLWEVPDPIQRVEYARNLGWSDDEIRSFHKIDVILDDMLAHAGGTIDQFKQFVAGVRTAQARGDFSGRAYAHGASLGSIQHFVQHSMDVGSIFLQNDPRVLIPDFVRSFTFAKHAGDAWNKALDTWRAVDRIQDEIGHRPFKQLAAVTLDWMDYVQRGYQPGTDMVLTTVQNTLNGVLGPLTGARISRGEARGFIQTLQTGFYRGAMGLQLHVMIRDAIQPLLTLPFVGPAHLASVIKTIAKGSKSAEFEDMLERAFNAGVAEQSLPRLESPGMFEGLLASTDEGGIMSEKNLAARERLARYTDGVTEILTPDMRTGLKKHLDTMRFYTRQGTWHRIISGEAAYRKFMSEYTPWLAQGAQDFRQFAKSINLHSWGGAENRSIQESIAGGNVEEAAQTYMRLVADRTQFAYGTRHAPPAIRTTGAKLGFMLGNFSVQSLDLVRNISRVKSLDVAAKMAATVGLIHYLLAKGEDETGYPLRKMSPVYAFTFLGGPLFTSAVDLYQTADDARRIQYNQMTNRPIDNRAQGRISKISVPGMILGAANQVNPLRGVMTDVRGIGQIVRSEDPLYSAGRFITTGATQGSEIDNEHRLRGVPEIQEILAPMSATPQVVNPRTISPSVRLPGANQYAPIRRGDPAPSINEQIIRSQFDSTQKFLEQMVSKGKLGSGGGAF